MVNFTCPNCKGLATHPTPGQKVQCPFCGQKLLVPAPPPQNKTILATWEEVTGSPAPPAPEGAQAPPPLPQQQQQQQPLVPWQESRPRRRRRAGDDYDDDDYEDEWPRGRPGFRCPFCRSRARPFARQRVAAAGWVLMGVIIVVSLIAALFCCLFVLFAPLCVLAILIKEDYRVCGDCGAHLP